MAVAFLVVLYTYLGLAAALSKDQWRSQSIYQLLTDRFAQTNGSTAPCGNLADYCGGTWQGIINNLDYIQDMGFTAIWISPIAEQIPGITYYGTAYHGFWPQQINQLNPNFGTAADLKALSDALHQRGMYLMVDTVTNDMAWNGSATTVDYSIYDVFNDESYYHPYCPLTDYQNSTQATQCWFGDEHLELPDLATENTTVVDKWVAWVSNITTFYGIDGIRLDACLEQDKQFFTPFETAADVYVICEVYNNPIDGVCDYQNYVSGLLNFPIWYLLVDAFGSNYGSITNLYSGITEMQGNCTDVSLLGNFVENHDVNRFPYNVSDSGLDQNAIAFAMLNDGIPIIYAGEEQHYSGGYPPANRETTWTSDYDTTNIYYQLIRQINLFRSCVIAKDSTYLTTNSVPFYLDVQVLGVKKGSSPATQVVSVFNNRGVEAIAYNITMSDTGWTEGDEVYELYTNETVTVDSNGNLPVYMYGGQPRIYYLLSSQCFGNGSTNSLAATQATTAIQPSVTTPAAATSISVPGSSTVQPAPIIVTSSSTTSSSVPGVTTAQPTPTIATSSSTTSSSVQPAPTIATSSSTTSSSVQPAPTIATSSSKTSSSVPGVTTVQPAPIIATSSSTTSSSVPEVTTVQSAPIIAASSSTASSSPSSSTTSSAVTVGPNSSSTPLQIAPSSTPILISETTSLTSSSGNLFNTPTSSVSVFSSTALPGTSSPAIVISSASVSNIPASTSISPTIPPSAAPTPATTPPECPSADGGSFTLNGYDFVVGCGIGSDQAYYAQLPGNNISDCAHICSTSTGASACEAVTYIDGVCYLKSEPGAVHTENGSDSAFIIRTPNGPETIASGFSCGNISQAAPTCPDANGNTFVSSGYVYVVGCSVDNFVVDISTSPGADLATCVESCITFSGTTSCTAVTLDSGNCHFKAAVGTVSHAVDVDTAFIIANNADISPGGFRPCPPPPGPPSAGNSPTSPIPTGNSPPPPNPAGKPFLPPNPTGTYTKFFDDEVIVYMPLNGTCP